MSEKILFSEVTAVTLSEQEVIQNAYVAVDGGKISYIGTEKPKDLDGFRVIDGKNKVLAPGLVNAHTHMPMAALRGYSDDTDLHTWLNKFIFPVEDKFTAETIKIATNLALLEAIGFGTTSLSDMYFFCDEMAEGCEKAGVKANISRGAHLFTEDFKPSEHKAMVELNALLEKWQNNDLIKIDCGIHGEYTTNYKLWEYVRDLAAKWNTRIHVHVSETRSEHEECLKRHNMTPTQIMAKHGVFDQKVIAAHGVFMTAEDMDIIKEKGASVVLCPVSNLKLASGVADGKMLYDKEIKLALGTDSVASNNNADLFEEIKLTATLQKERASDPACFNAADVLKIATKGGAVSQGRGNETGALAVGLDADLILLDFDKPHLYPCHNVVSNLVYSANGSDVCLTMVRGRILFENGEYKTIDLEKTKYEVKNILMPKLFM